MSFNRIRYDPDAKDVRLKQNVKSGHYMLYKGYPDNDKKCKPERMPKNSRNDSRQANYSDRTEIESRLQNRHVPLNGSNENHNEWKEMKSKLDNDPTCDNFESRPDEYTRLSHPVSDYRGINTLKNTIVPYLHVNKQISVSDKFQPFAVSTRDIARKAAVEKRRVNE
jgi:hypothetical protein